MSLNPENERKLRRNWSLLKQEINVDFFVLKFVEDGIFSPGMRGEIMNVIPNTASMKGNKVPVANTNPIACTRTFYLQFNRGKNNA